MHCRRVDSVGCSYDTVQRVCFAHATALIDLEWPMNELESSATYWNSNQMLNRHHIAIYSLENAHYCISIVFIIFM